MELGPIQLFVIAFDDNENFQGEILEELTAIRKRGVIRLVDSLFVMKEEDGNVTAMSASDFRGHEVAEVGAAIRALLGIEDNAPNLDVESEDPGWVGIGLTPADIAAAADALDPGTSTLYLLIEHSWARNLRRAVLDAGGYPVIQGMLTQEALLMVGAELEAIIEAEETIEMAARIKGEALLDALITVETADAVAEEAMRQVADIVDTADDVRATAAAESVLALIDAGLIDESQAETATVVLVEAGLITAELLAAAEATASGFRDEN